MGGMMANDQDADLGQDESIQRFPGHKSDRMAEWIESARSTGDVDAMIHLVREYELDARYWARRVRQNFANHTEMAWAIYRSCVDEYDGLGARRWGAVAIEGTFPVTSESGLSVDPHIFAPWPHGSTDIEAFDTSILVETDQIEQAAVALENCGARLRFVTETGVEYAGLEEEESDSSVNAEGSPLTTPGYISDVERTSSGVGLTFSTDGWMWGPMAVAMISIVIEELQATGVTSARIGPVANERSW
jgi:hypothetical protein